jgi:hypothetical protein
VGIGSGLMLVPYPQVKIFQTVQRNSLTLGKFSMKFDHGSKPERLGQTEMFKAVFLGKDDDKCYFCGKIVI